jgi:hypothetical protein
MVWDLASDHGRRDWNKLRDGAIARADDCACVFFYMTLADRVQFRREVS